MCFANNPHNNRALFNSFLCIFDLKDTALRRESYGIVVVVVSKHVKDVTVVERAKTRERMRETDEVDRERLSIIRLAPETIGGVFVDAIESVSDDAKAQAASGSTERQNVIPCSLQSSLCGRQDCTRVDIVPYHN